MKFNIQRFADSSVSAVAPSLVQQAWAEHCWESGFNKSFFKKFTGESPTSIIQIKTELRKRAGDTINIPLLMPLTGNGVTGDNMLEGNEEQLIYRDFSVTIDQLRNGVRIEGKMEEQKTTINMRKNAKTALSDWLATTIDKKFFSALSDSPSNDRIIFGGTATSEAGIGASDVFTADLIGKAKRLACEDENTMVKPVKIDGVDTYVLILDQWQTRDLMNDTKWLEAQRFANVRGNKNPIFTGCLGMYDGVVVHTCNRILRTTTGSSGTKVDHALFLGQQAPFSLLLILLLGLKILLTMVTKLVSLSVVFSALKNLNLNMMELITLTLVVSTF
ncbi:MAG: N4-gp56 family major capsid protein [Selenomonadaceae bacterium]|nr:N4-gp56 family major capsid protein [Selenomonadaceae bacterium]